MKHHEIQKTLIRIPMNHQFLEEIISSHGHMHHDLITWTTLRRAQGLCLLHLQRQLGVESSEVDVLAAKAAVRRRCGQVLEQMTQLGPGARQGMAMGMALGRALGALVVRASGWQLDTW